MNKETEVTISNQMCGVTYRFGYSKSEFMSRFHNQLAGQGYFIDNTTDGKTLVINPSNCSFIEVVEAN